MRFLFDEEAYRLGVRGIYFIMHGLINLPSADARVQEFVSRHISRVPNPEQLSIALAGYEQLHAAVSARPDKLKSSPGNLLAYFLARRDIPRINGLVDVYNAISLVSGVAIGAHDLRAIEGDIELRLTRGNERFLPLGSPKPVKVPAGEYAYVDASNDILCRLEVRQVEKSKVTMDSTDVFVIVQGHQYIDPALIEATTAQLVAAYSELFGGRVEPLYP